MAADEEHRAQVADLKLGLLEGLAVTEAALQHPDLSAEVRAKWSELRRIHDVGLEMAREAESMPAAARQLELEGHALLSERPWVRRGTPAAEDFNQRWTAWGKKANAFDEHWATLRRQRAELEERALELRRGLPDDRPS